MKKATPLVACAAAFLLLATGGGAQAAQNPFCLPGSGTGQCTNPQGVATDFETGHVIVADKGNNRGEIFEADGTFIKSFGQAELASPNWVAVDNDAPSASHHNIWATTEGGKGTSSLIKKFSASGEFIEAESIGSVTKQGTGVCEFQANDPIAVGPGGDVYVADSYDKDGAGPGHVFANRAIVFPPSGGACLEELSLFEGEFKTIRNFAVDSTGHVYVTVAGAGGFIRKYSPNGSPEPSFESPYTEAETEGLGVDSAGNLFAKQRGQTVARQPAASTQFFTEFAPSGAPLRRFDYEVGGLNVPALAPYLDPTEKLHLYASQGNEGIRDHSLPPPGPVLVPGPCRVKNNKPGSSSATLVGEVNPEGKATTFGFEYLTQAKFEEEGNEFKNAQSSGEVPLGGSADFELHEAALKVEGLEGETAYRCRIVTKNADSVGAGTVGEEGSFQTTPTFIFGGAWSTEVGPSTARVFVEGNPQGNPATGQVEYVTDAQYQASKWAEAVSVPTPELDFGASEEMQLRSVALSGLAPDTVYHYRLRARNGLPPEGIVCLEHKTECPELEHTFRTYPLAVASEADGRRYELVSPGQKNSAEVAVPGPAAGLFEDRSIRIQAGATSGEAVTYTSWTSFGEAEGAQAASQYLSKRTAGGWVTENISPFGFLADVLFNPFGGFSPDLRYGAFKTTEPPLVAGCRTSEDLYLRDNETGALRCLTPEAPEGPEAVCLTYAGSSEDASRSFVAGKPAGGENFKYSLYESTAAGTQLVSVLPSGEAAPATEETAFGYANAIGGISNCHVTQTIMRHVISTDGSRAFWTYVPEGLASVSAPAPGTRTLTITGAAGGTFKLSFHSQTTTPIAYNANAATIQSALAALSEIGAGNVEVSGTGPFTITFKGPLAGTTDPLSADSSALNDAPRQLFVRVEGTKTEQLDKKEKGAKAGSGENKGVFQGANADGSIAYFTDSERLISGSQAKAGEPDLYRYEVGRGQSLKDLTAGAVPGNVKGVVGMSDDGSYLYFVAGAALDTGAEAGKNNLYLFHEDETHYIATLSSEDAGDWSIEPRVLSARVSPDGQHLAFLSVEAQKLAHYENHVASGEHCQYNANEQEGGTVRLEGGPLCPQAFLYDAGSDAITCASCNPSGSRPLGPTIFPGWSNAFEGPRFLSEDGNRLVFQSLDALTPVDTNGRMDVYEFERPSEGSCGAANPNLDTVSGGCHFLVSSGASDDESYLVDASANGRDVFFSTRQALVGWDVNENFDVYDYRGGGGFPEPPAMEEPCGSSDSCKPPETAPPPAPTPATPSFNGPGNPKPKPAKKKQHKKKHKHGKKKHGKGKQTKKKGRAGR